MYFFKKLFPAMVEKRKSQWIFSKERLEKSRAVCYINSTMENNEYNYISVREEAQCPGCGEKLQPVDLESFPRCPYCDFEFTKDDALEDFVYSPLVKRWLRTMHQNFPN